jgi:hypothetical protein
MIIGNGEVRRTKKCSNAVRLLRKDGFEKKNNHSMNTNRQHDKTVNVIVFNS